MKIKITAFDLAERFVGIAEVPGKVANPAILAMLRLDQSWPENDEVPWCFAGDVEILTSDGFVRFSALRDDALVAQVDPFLGIVGFVRPLRLIRREYSGPLVTMTAIRLGLTCDPQHRFLGVWNRANRLAGPMELRPISDLTSNLYIPAVVTACEIDNPLWSDETLRLLAAFLSDGFLKKKHRRIAVQVSKERKLEALASLAPAHVYRAPRTYGLRTKKPLTTFEYQVPPQFEDLFAAGYKMPSWDLLWSLSRRQLLEFVSAYGVFDGSSRGGARLLYTSSEYLRDWLQTAVTLAGYHSSWKEGSRSQFSGKPCFTINYCPETRTRVVLPSRMEYRQGTADLFCVEVPTGIIVIRDPKGAVIPVGNCSAFTNYVCWLLRLPRSKSLRARSWLQIGHPVTVNEARRGFDVVILSRGDGEQPGPEVIEAPGHVGFLADAVGDDIHILGGNQGNRVSIAPYDFDRVLGIRRLL